jgi:thioredoxin-related protein
MKRLNVSILFLFVSLVVTAQSGIKFEHASWAEVLKKAESENKMIFVDCYTSWCGPCKKLAKEIFPQQNVGEYFNEHFVSVKIDMEKGEGIELKDQLEVSAFPTLLFLSKKGNEQHRIVGFRTADKLIAEAKKAKGNKGFGSYVQRYENGERSVQFINEYLSVLAGSYKKEEASRVAIEYLNSVPEEELMKAENWKMIHKHIADPFSREIKYVQKNRAAFIKTHGQRMVEQKLSVVFSTAARSFAKRIDGKYILDEKGYQEYIDKIEKMGARKIERIKEGAELHFAQVLENWEEYTSMINKKIQKMKADNRVSSTLIWNYAMRLEQKCDDRTARDKAVKWMELAIEHASSEKSKSTFNRTLESLKKERVSMKH